MNNHRTPNLNINVSRQKKKVENLPRTGIEYPFLKERRIFLKTHKEFELLSEYSIPPLLLDEYVRNDSERANALPNAN